MCIGIGGSPEGIVTTCAIKALGGHIQGRLWARDDDEKQRGMDAGLKLDGYVYEADEMVQGNNTLFVATGVTDGALVAGVSREGDYLYTESVVLRGVSGTLRRISSEHLVSKWL
jgi:fructose-1,6-bisphosphatase II